MGIASSSAARLGDAAPTGALPGSGQAPARPAGGADSPAYGSLELMGQPKKKKKPVLVLDPDELAKAHQLFQDGAAQQMDEFDWDERPSAVSGLVPMGSEDLPEDRATAPVEDAEPEADLPDPDKVLSLTKAEHPPAAETVSEPAKPRKTKKMALDPARLEGDPDFVPPVGDVQGFGAMFDGADDHLAEDEPEASGGLAGNVPEVAPEAPETPPVTQETDEIAASPATAIERSMADETPEQPPVDAAPPAQQDEAVPSAEPEAAPPSEPSTGWDDSESADEPAADVPAEPVADPALEAPSERYEEFTEEEVDGTAFMRGPERQRINTAGMDAAPRNHLRARLVRPEDVQPEPEPQPGFFARLWRSLFG